MFTIKLFRFGFKYKVLTILKNFDRYPSIMKLEQPHKLCSISSSVTQPCNVTHKSQECNSAVSTEKAEFNIIEALPGSKKGHFINDDVTSLSFDLEPKDTRSAFNIIDDVIKNDSKSDVPHFIDDMAPPLPVSFNLAAFANRSFTLQQLVDLGVDLSKIEQRAEHAKFIMTLDFEVDMKKHIRFLHDVGVPADELGHFLTKNPLIFKEDLNDLEVRINYLKSKKFSTTAIARIVTKNPLHLSLNTKTVDKRLGFYQKTFSLSGNEVRFVITKRPNLVSFRYDKLQENIFSVKEEMGFTPAEMKALLLEKPKIYTLSRKALTERFNYIHGTMGFSHEKILQFPGALLTRKFIIEQRHKYLVKLGRAQYDPSQPGYVSLADLAVLSDGDFCFNHAKTSVLKFNEFLKTL